MDLSFLNNISQGYNNWFDSLEQIFRKISEIKDDIYNMPYNTGLYVILSLFINLLIVLYLLNRRRMGDKIKFISLIVALIFFIPAFYIGNSFYDKPVFKEYKLPNSLHDQKTSRMPTSKGWTTETQYLEQRRQSIISVENHAEVLRQQGYRVYMREDEKGNTIWLEINPPLSEFTTGIWFGLQGFILSLLVCQVIMGFIDWHRQPAE